MTSDDQLERLKDANVILTDQEQAKYVKDKDVLEDVTVAPKGYKRCTKCNLVKKLYLFNRNSQSKDNCTSQCKECQKKNAHKSYAKNKSKRDYKQYYQENKEAKQQQSRQYYLNHKEEMRAKHAAYRVTTKGKKAMTRAHTKRAKLLKKNTGIPYTREMVIERDCQGGTEPICYLCNQPITGAIHLDHVIPVVMGGKDCFTNIACVHDICNLSKSKDGREITTEQVEFINRLSEDYMEAHHDLFPDVFGDDVTESESDIKDN